MKLYLASYSTCWKRFFCDLQIIEKINFLESYLYFKNKSVEDDYKLYKKKFFLDSWAFSQATLWKKIDIQEYIKYIKLNKEYLELYANLDVIWNAEATLKNQEIMEQSWLNPLPTYHLWSPKRYFEEMCKKYNYIWLWWMVPYARKPGEIKKFLDYCFNYILKNKLKTKIHWWGMTNPKFIKRYPFYSVDSTWWLCGGRFNTIYQFVNWQLLSDNSAGIRKKRGVDLWKLTYQQKNLINIVELYKYMDYVTQLHKVKWMEYWK